MGRAIVDFEARRDKAGHLMVYHPPANDGGGSYEVAGINQKYDPKEAAHLVELVNAGKFDEAESYAAEYIAKNTDAAMGWCSDPGVEFYLRDCVFNRGARGAARILQRAVVVVDDGIVGPQTRAATQELTAADLLTHLRWAREDYERNVVGYRENFWNGLVHRWDASLATAYRFSSEPPANIRPQPVPPATEIRPQPVSRSWWQVLLDAIVAILFGTRPPAEPPPYEPPPPDELPPGAPQPEPRWLTEARKDIGFHEKGVNLGIEGFINEGHTGHLGDPWCAIFVNAKLEECGIPGTRSAMARSFENHKNFVELDGPALGAISTYWRGSPKSGSGHVNFYAGTDAHGHIGIGGNQRDSVSAAYMEMGRHTGWWWPRGVMLPKIGPVHVSGINAVTSGKET